MKKTNKRYVAAAGALILVGGVAVLSTNSFADSATTLPVPAIIIAPTAQVGVTPSTETTEVSDMLVAPSVSSGTETPAVTNSSDDPEVGDITDSSATDENSDSSEAGDTTDSSVVVSISDAPETGDTADSSD